MKQKAQKNRLVRKYVWRDERADEYIFQLGEQENGLRDLSSDLTRLTSSQEIDDNIQKFTSLMENVCDPLFSKKVSLSKNTDINDNSNQPWFDDDVAITVNSFILP